MSCSQSWPHFLLPDSEEVSFRADPPWGPVPAAPPGQNWNGWMGKALELAATAASQGEVPVGAVVVNAVGTIVGQGHNETLLASDPSAHAEIVAMRRAALALESPRLTDCILVVTLEPCLMCTGAIREARLSGVVYGARDARAGGVVSCLDGLDMNLPTPRPWHYGGIRAKECVALLQAFFQQLR